MPEVTLRVLDVFHLSVTPGPMIFCTISGNVNVGDVFELRLPVGNSVYGTVFNIHPHLRPNAGPDEANLGIQGEAAEYLEPGMTLHRVQSQE